MKGFGKSFVFFMTSAIVLAAAGLAFGKGNELIFMIFIYYILLPLIGFVCSALSAKRGGVKGYIAPLIYIGVAAALPFTVFGKTDIAFFLFDAAFCLSGMLLGIIIRALGKLFGRKNASEQENEEPIQEEALPEDEQGVDPYEETPVEEATDNSEAENGEEESSEAEDTEPEIDE